MSIAGVNDVEITDGQLVTNNDVQIVNFDNNTVIDGYGGSYIDNYIKYIDGLNLEIDYYSFVRGDNGENSLLDPNDPTQQYIEVKQVLLKITSTLPDYSNYEELSLDAILDANIIPAENDIAILRLPNGLVGVFKVSINSKRSYITKKIYDIKLSFLYFKKDNILYYNNLISKIKKKYIYDKSFITTNSSPLLLEDTYRHKVEVNNIYTELISQYLKLFTYEKVISVDVGYRWFDINIQNLIVTFIDGGDYTMLKVVESDASIKNVINTLIAKNKNLSLIPRYYDVVSVVYDISLSHTISMLSGGVDKSIHTTTVETNISAFGGIASTIIPNNYRTGTTNLYMFSNAFYNGFDGLEELSLLEVNLMRYLSNEIIPYEDITAIVNDISNWSDLEQYNYIPMVLLLLRYFNLNTYDRI